MQQALLSQLQLILKKLDLQPGDRLPPERELAKALKVTRNSLRRLLHMLEGRGLVDIKKGSGTYLKAGVSSLANFPLSDDKITASTKLLTDQLESAYLFFHIMVELAALRITKSQLEELQERNVALSRSIFSEDPQKVWMESLSFFRTIAIATNNTFMVNIMDVICSVDMASFKHFFEINQGQQEQLFGDHVNILHALRERNCNKAKLVTQKYVMHLSQILESQEGIVSAAILKDQLTEAE
ncbi:FadR/GntR family transcriptional regulator [Desulfogranum mediterraneum]|uniref:FadR/GntR family transcriptional regulator n=1 Tax=Desulfogranum mediterraneum TaxID=160661 RepID=UPI00048B0753|nr:GntR family transcriptional regulator [Desulfogranum mediterraneum]